MLSDLSVAVKEVRDAVVGRSLGYDEPEWDSVQRARYYALGVAMRIKAAVDADLAYVEDLASHACVWDRETDYCTVCGADGRG